MLLRRRTIRASLTEWARHRGFEPASHQSYLIERLDAVARGDIDRLAVFMPPGSAKSTYASVLFPPHYLAKNPTHGIIAASHTVELAEKFGRRVRNSIAEDGATLGINVQADNSAAGRWALTSGGEYYAAGVGVGIAGFRADLGIIDDPIRSREDADSDRVRQRIWDWFSDDFQTRLKPGGRVVLIQTRWHEDDLAGRILNSRDAARWSIVNLPAFAMENDPLGREVGDPLWSDDNYGYGAQLAQARPNMTARTFSALYQQQPAPETGDLFKAEWLRLYDVAPNRQTLKVYGASDYAVTKDGGDYTVHIVVGMDPAGDIWLLDLWRGQASPDVWIEQFCDMVKKWRPLAWAEETGQITSGIGPFLVERMRQRGAYVVREQFPTRGDKVVRVASMRGRVALRGLYCPSNAAWLPDFKSELLRFPAGAHDDQVDALGLVGQLLSRMFPGQPIEPDNANRPVRDWFDENEEPETAWRVA